jgi:hypothetical protein
MEPFILPQGLNIYFFCATHYTFFIYSSMLLQPFVGPWPFLQFRNIFYADGRTPWTSDQSVARPLPKHRTTQTQNKRIHIHAASGIINHDLGIRASEDSSCLRQRGHRDRHSIQYVCGFCKANASIQLLTSFLLFRHVV